MTIKFSLLAMFLGKKGVSVVADDAAGPNSQEFMHLLSHGVSTASAVATDHNEYRTEGPHNSVSLPTHTVKNQKKPCIYWRSVKAKGYFEGKSARMF